jgi:nitrogenase molybdenum-iron protein beta chain
VWGYQGAMNVLVWILDKILDEADRESVDGCSFDAVR